MKAFKSAILAAVLLATVAPCFSAVYIQDFPGTRDMWIGRALYATNVNYSTRRFGRVAKGNGQDGYIVDVDRAAALTFVQNAYTAVGAGTLTNMSQIGNGAVTMYLELTAYDSWEECGAPFPPTVFGHMFTPGVRLSKGQNWDEATATYSWAATVGGVNQPWHDQNGAAIASIFLGFNYASNDTRANMVLNSTSQTWGQATEMGGGADYYVYDITRPWKLDNSVAWAALKNPDAVGFQMVHDFRNRPWALQSDGTYADDDNTGSLYGIKHGLTEFRPFVEVVVDTSKITTGGVAQTYWAADFNNGPVDNTKSPVQHGKVDFADYLILEANFGKSGMTNGQGDADGNGKVDFADYLILEAQFGKTTPEPATIGLLVLGGMSLLRRRR